MRITVLSSLRSPRSNGSAISRPSAIYGDQDGNWVDESTEPKPNTARTEARVEAERAWLAFGEETGVQVHIFRLAGIYGPGRSVFDKLRDGTARRIKKGSQVFSRIHVEDIASVLEASIARPRAGAIYNVADDEPAAPGEVVAYAAELLGMTPPPEVPFEEADLTPMARSFYEGSRRIANARIKSELGVELRYPTYREGLAALLEETELCAPWIEGEWHDSRIADARRVPAALPSRPWSGTPATG